MPEEFHEPNAPELELDEPFELFEWVLLFLSVMMNVRRGNETPDTKP